MNTIKIIASVLLGNNSVVKEVKPIISDLKITDELDLYLIKRYTNGSLIFINDADKGIYDFDFIKQCESYDFTNIINIDIYVNGILDFKGKFKPAECIYDNDRCTAEVQLTADYKYDCLVDYWETKENIISEVVPAQMYRIPNPIKLRTFDCKMEYIVETLNVLPNSPPIYNHASDWLPGNLINTPLTQGLPLPEWDPTWYPYLGMNVAYDCFNIIFGTGNLPLKHTLRPVKSSYTHKGYIGTWVDPFTSITYRTALTEITTTWAAETITTLNDPLTGAPVAPVGTGWISFQSYIYAGLPATEWLRIPYYNNQTYKYYNYIQNTDVRVYELVSPYINDPNNTYMIRTGRDLGQTIQMFLTKSGCGLTFKSKFFFDGINPVTNEINKLNSLTLNNCSDLKNYPAEQPATILQLSLKEILENLQYIFNVAWYIKDNDFIIEHVSYFENNYSYSLQAPVYKDITTIKSENTGKSELIKTNKYKYNINELSVNERFSFVTKQYPDFQDVNIKYDINSDNKVKEYSIAFVTDVAGVFNFPNEYSNKATVLIAIELQKIDFTNNIYGWVIINEKGLRSFEMVVNGHLCMYNLFERYFNHARFLLNGVVDGIFSRVFLSQICKKDNELSVTDCEDLIKINETIKTFTGNGRAVKVSKNIHTNVKDITVKYD